MTKSDKDADSASIPSGIQILAEHDIEWRLQKQQLEAIHLSSTAPTKEERDRHWLEVLRLGHELTKVFRKHAQERVEMLAARTEFGKGD